MVLPLTLSVVCDAPLGVGKTCTKKTKDPSGRCHLHLNVPDTATAATNGQQQCAASVASAAAFQQEPVDTDAPVAWLPEDGVPKGHPAGTTVLVADGDVEDSTVVAMHYLDPAGGEGAEALHLKLTPEAEDRMLDALGLTGTHTKLVTKGVEKHGPHQLDNEHGLFSKTAQIAKSYNSRVKQEQDLSQIQEINGPRLEELKATLAGLESKVGDDPAAQKMLSWYQGQYQFLHDKVYATEPPLPYLEGGKISPDLEQWSGAYTEMVTEEVPVDNPDLDQAALPTMEVEGKRLSAHLDHEGRSTWKRGAMSKGDCPPKMWKIDLGDGYQALYYPTKLANNKGYAWRRRMTVVAPTGGDAASALERLDRLHISGEPMRGTQAEYTYLERNLYAAGALDHPQVQKARVEAADFAQALAKERVMERASETAGMDQQQTREWLRKQRLAAESEALPFRARRLRDAAASVFNYPSGEALAKDPSYEPSPVLTGTGVTWRRFATTPGAAPVPKTVRYTHSGKSANLVAVIKAGGLLPTVRRRQAGFAPGQGQSEAADVKSGGASSVFTHMQTVAGGSKPSGSGSGEFRMIWEGEQAEAMSQRADWYATPGDNWGALNPQDTHYTTKVTRKTDAISNWAGGQVMFEGSIGMRAHAPTWIMTGSASRPAVIQAFKEQGLGALPDGRKIEDVVI